MHRLALPALALALILPVSAALAASDIEAPPGSGQRYPGTMLINPQTGQPVSPATGNATPNPYPANDYSRDGTDASGVTPPSGAVGIRGWLSGIYKALTTGITILQGGQPNTPTNQFFEQTVGPSMQAPGSAATIARAMQRPDGKNMLTANDPVTSIAATGATMTTSQPSVGTTAAALALPGTVHREVFNPAANSAPIYIGNSSAVTTATGYPVPPGSSYNLSQFSGPIYAIAASAQTVALISY